MPQLQLFQFLFVCIIHSRYVLYLHEFYNILFFFCIWVNPAGVLCEITLPNGTMARMPDVIEFSKEHDMPVVTIEDIITYRKENNV